VEKEKEREREAHSSTFLSLGSSSNPTTTLSLLEISVEDMAQQLTVMDEEMLHKLVLSDFYRSAWTKKDRAPNLEAATIWYDLIIFNYYRMSKLILILVICNLFVCNLFVCLFVCLFVVR
jgi:hypothetical protein